MRIAIVYTVIPLCMLGIVSAGKAEPLKVKPGLWETTTVTEKRGGSRPANLDQLTPEQRAKVEKELARRVKKETHTARSCLRADQIKNGSAFIGNLHRSTCSKTMKTQTASDVSATIECRGANLMTGTVAMHAADEVHMSGKVDMTYGESGKLQLFTHSDIRSTWVAADCGTAPKAAGKYHH